MTGATAYRYFSEKKKITTRGLTVHPRNPRYFMDRSTGRPVLLMGRAHGINSPQRPSFDASTAERELRKTVEQWHTNHARLWHFTPWALPKGVRMPWKRTEGKSMANDGFGRFDLDQWDETYWANLRSFMQAAENCGIYYQVMLFDRCGLSRGQGRWFLNPYNPDNNVNDIPDLPCGEGDGRADNAMFNLANRQLLHYQEAYVERLIRETAEYRSTVFEVCNEYCDLDFEPGPRAWEEHWTRFIKARCDNIVCANNLGWKTDPPGTPERYWENADLDMVNWHTILPEDAFEQFARHYDRGKALCHGEQAYACNENLGRTQTCSNAELRRIAWGAFLGGGHLAWDEANEAEPDGPDRATRSVARFIRDTGFDFVNARPRPDLADGRWCMAQEGTEYAVYLPEGGSVTSDLDGTDELAATWYRPEDGAYENKGMVSGNGKKTVLPSPFEGDGVLYLTQKRP